MPHSVRSVGLPIVSKLRFTANLAALSWLPKSVGGAVDGLTAKQGLPVVQGSGLKQGVGVFEILRSHVVQFRESRSAGAGEVIFEIVIRSERGKLRGVHLVVTVLGVAQ